MHSNIYARLIILTAGTLLPFFWIVVILGHRRQRNFERIFFFLCLALVCFFGGSLLALNAQLYYPVTPQTLEQFTWIVVCVGLWLLPSLLMHLQIEYAQVRELFGQPIQFKLRLALAYVPALFLLTFFSSALRGSAVHDFSFPAESLGRGFQVWLVLAFFVSSAWQFRFARVAPDKEQRTFHFRLASVFVSVAFLVFSAHFALWKWPASRGFVEACQDYVLLFALVPLLDLLRNVQKFNFLQIGRQRNLLYAVFAAFVGLLYLSFARRAGLWLEPYFPPEATAALLLFLPVVFFEPLQRLVGRILLRAAQSEMDQANRTMGPIQDTARLGNVEQLRTFAQLQIAEQFQLANVELSLGSEHPTTFPLDAIDEYFPIRKHDRVIGVLRAQPYGAMLSGETTGALEFLCEQLPAAFDLCRLIEEKLRLERELAERERLAALGQMAASVSHNLKNPLGSIKTILQVQIESDELPPTFRAETKMVLAEIDRLSTKLNQLLQFSRPTVLGDHTEQHCDAAEVLREVTQVLRPEADRRRISLSATAPRSLPVTISHDALNDILSNLLVNALDAAPPGGHITLHTAQSDALCTILVEDDGPGIPADSREKVLQPFFTTKSQGTGLGLAIVARRVADAGGQLDWESPVANSRGTRFRIRLHTPVRMISHHSS